MTLINQVQVQGEAQVDVRYGEQRGKFYSVCGKKGSGSFC